MVVSIDTFKQAFSGKLADHGLKESDAKVAESLKQLKTAVEAAGQANGASQGLKAALTKLVERYAATRDKQGGPAADSAAELDKILSQSQAVFDRIEAVPAASPAPTVLLRAPAPPTASPAPTPAPTPPKSGPLRTKVLASPDSEKVRSALENWVAGKVSKTRAPFLVEASNWQYVFLDAKSRGLEGAEFLAELKSGPAGVESVEFSLDPKFEPKEKFWTVEDGYVPVIIDVIDDRTGRPIKGAVAKFPSGNSYTTDGEGRVKLDLLRNPQKSSWSSYSKSGGQTKHRNVEVTAPGYSQGNLDIEVGERGWKGGIRLIPTAGKDGEDLVQVVVHDVSDDYPIRNAKVTIGRNSKTTEAHGIVQFALAPGKHSFTVTAKDYVEATGSLDTKKDRELSVAMRQIGAADLLVRVVSNRQKPIEKATASIGNVSARPVTDSRGEATFRGLPAGKYGISVYADGFRGVSFFEIDHNSKSAGQFHLIELASEK